MGGTSPGAVVRKPQQYLLRISPSTGPAIPISRRQADPAVRSKIYSSGQPVEKGVRNQYGEMPF
jgi:hypothetical protein